MNFLKKKRLKYDSLYEFLKKNNSNEVTLSFSKIENLINRKLPKSSKKYSSQFWSNGGHFHSYAWLNAGFKTNLKKLPVGQIIFIKNEKISYNY